MKKLSIASVILFFIATHCLAQDIITKRNGEDVKAKVFEINDTEVKYKMFDNPDGPTFIESRANLVMIRYANGTQTYFDEQPKPATAQPAPAPASATPAASSVPSVPTADLYTKGQFDASHHYTRYKGAGTGTLLTSLLSPLVGLIPAIACSSTPPKVDNLGYPNKELMAKDEYSNGYKQKARRMKSGKVWLNWGIGFAVNVVLVVAFL